MHEAFRPTAEQYSLFASLAAEVKANPSEYDAAARWFATEYSIRAIDRRKRADLTPHDIRERQRFKKAGWVVHERKDPSGYMERLLRATESLIEIDDTALPRPDRIEHYRRSILVGVLLTDADFKDNVHQLAKALKMDRSHWPTGESLTVSAGGEVELNRWWAREMIFDPDSASYRPFEPLLRRALDSVGEGRELGVAHPAPLVAPKVPPATQRFSAGALGDADRAVLFALELARRETPPHAVTGDQIRLAAESWPTRRFSFRDQFHVSQTVRSLRKRSWPIPNAMNGTGYRLDLPLAQLCPELAAAIPTDDQLTQ